MIHLRNDLLEIESTAFVNTYYSNGYAQVATILTSERSSARPTGPPECPGLQCTATVHTVHYYT